MRVSVDGRYSYYALLLLEEGVYLDPGAAEDPLTAPGLVTTWPGGIVLHTAAHSGTARVTIETASEPLAPVDGEWEAVEEVNFTSVSGSIRPVDRFGDGTSDPTPVALPTPAARYRLRVHATGQRAAESIHGVADHVESFALQFWPAGN